MKINLADDRKRAFTDELKTLFQDEFELELSDFRADDILSLCLKTLCPAVYNQAVQDVRSLQGYMEPFDAPDQFIGKAVKAAPITFRGGASGKLANAVRWADMEYRRPVLHARRTSLHSACGRNDHGAKCA